MSSVGFHNRDKVLNSFHNLLEISYSYGFEKHDSDTISCIESSNNKLLEILQQIESKNEVLNEVKLVFNHKLLLKKITKIVQVLKPSDMNRLKKSIKQTNAFDCNYLNALKVFKDSLKNVLENMDTIIEKINKEKSASNIKMEFKYQKLVSKFLEDTQKELTECEENAKFFKTLKDFLRDFRFNTDIVKYDFEFVGIYEKLKQSIELLITFNEKLNEVKRKNTIKF